MLNVYSKEKIITGQGQLPQNLCYSLPKAIYEYQSFFFQITGLLSIKERLIYLSFLICVEACVDRQVLENRGVNIQEARGVLYCVLCFINSLII